MPSSMLTYLGLLVDAFSMEKQSLEQNGGTELLQDPKFTD